MEICNSDANQAVVHAQNHRSRLGPIDTCYSGPEVAVLDAKATGGVLDPQRLVILVLMSLFCMHNTTGEGWNPYSLFILVLSSLLCVLKTTDEGWNPHRVVIPLLIKMFFKHKATGEVWEPWRLVILVKYSLFCKQKSQMRAGTYRD